MGRAFFICALVITVLGLIGMGGILALSHFSEPFIQATNGVMETLGLVSTADDLSLPAVWERLAVPVYTCASIALLSLVALFVIRKPKPTRLTSMEGPA